MGRRMSGSAANRTLFLHVQATSLERRKSVPGLVRSKPDAREPCEPDASRRKPFRTEERLRVD